MKLTTRQWKTYELIKSDSLQGKKTTQYEIYKNYPIERFKDGYVWNDKKKSHDNCPAIWADIERINFSEEIEKIVIYKNFEYWLCSSVEEAQEFAKCYLVAALKKLKRHWQVIEKVKKDGQCKLFSTKGDLIDSKSRARNYIESYLEQGVEELLNNISSEE